MNEFKTFHPIVNFIYFLFVIGFSCFFMNPVCLVISGLCAFLYLAVLKGRKVFKSLLYALPLMILTALINPMFNHEGVTVLKYLPSGNPLTLESVVYGGGAAVMIWSVILWFSCYNAVMTSDKFIYLFGKVIPLLSLILSMTMRFVPRFTEQIKAVTNAQRCIGRDVSKGNLLQRIKTAVSIVSVVVTWALENSIETADSMRSRGYGIKGRTAFSIFTFEKRDAVTLSGIMALGIYTFVGNICGGMYFRYFPSIKWAELSPFGISVFLSYFILCLMPVIIELWEVRRWKALKSKI